MQANRCTTARSAPICRSQRLDLLRHILHGLAIKDHSFHLLQALRRLASGFLWEGIQQALAAFIEKCQTERNRCAAQLAVRSHFGSLKLTRLLCEQEPAVGRAPVIHERVTNQLDYEREADDFLVAPAPVLFEYGSQSLVVKAV